MIMNSLDGIDEEGQELKVLHRGTTWAKKVDTCISR